MDDVSKRDRADDVRRRLVSISDELRELAPDDFPGKHRLNVEADDLRQRLDELTEDDAETASEWADRAARKGSDADDSAAAKASIVSPHEGGGSAW